MNREYLQTMIISKAVLLDRENQGDVEKYNKLLEDYYNLLFEADNAADLSKNDKKSINSMMAGFRKHVAGKDLGSFSTTKRSFKGSDFSDADIKNIGQYAKDIKKGGKK